MQYLSILRTLAAFAAIATSVHAAKNPCHVDGKTLGGIVTPVKNQQLQSGVQYTLLFCSELTFKSDSKSLELKLTPSGTQSGYVLQKHLKPTIFHKEDGTDIEYYNTTFTIESNPAQIGSSTKYLMQAEETYHQLQLQDTDLFNIYEVPVQVTVSWQ